MYMCCKLNRFVASALVIIITVGVSVALIAASFNSVFADVAVEEDDPVFVPVIMYHSILKNPSRQGDYVVSPETFENDVKYLCDNGYTPVFIAEIVDYVDYGKPLPEKPVVITFDDGYYNNVTYALPIIEKYKIKANINVVGSFVQLSSDANEHNPAYSNLTWDDIRELNDNGRIEIGNHSYDLHSMNGRKGCMKLAGETDEEYKKVLYDDVGLLQDLLEVNSDVRPIVFAYPYGKISDESIDIFKEMGFRALLTCYEKPNYITQKPGDIILLNRYNRPSGMSTEQFMQKLLSEDK